MYFSTIVDASYIQKHYSNLGVLGCGKDIYHGLPSTIYLMRESKGTPDQADDETGNKFALQIYESLSPEMFAIKARQLQLTMTDHLTNLVTRVKLLAMRQNNMKSIDLYALYDFHNFDTSLSQKRGKKEEDPFLNTEEDARELLQFLSMNLMLQGRFTNEFLDIAPANIFLNNENPEYGKYVVSNFGLNYEGTRFHKVYSPITDSFNKEKVKQLSSTIYSYSFKAALVVLVMMTDIDVRDLFFEDGQFKDSLAQQVLLAILKRKPDIDEKQKKKLADEKTALIKQIPSLMRKETQLTQVFTKEFVTILSQLLSIDQSKRSIFNLLVMHPENILKVEYPVVEGLKFNNALYFGQGKVEQDQEVIPNGCGTGFVLQEDETKVQYSGCFDNGNPTGMNCKEVRVDGRVKSYVIDDKQVITNLTKLLEEDSKYAPIGYVYEGEFDVKTLLPNGYGKMIMILPMVNNLMKKQTPIEFDGTFDKGKKKSGREFYKGKNQFDGDFLGDFPSKGQMIYRGNDHLFDGTFKGQGYERKAGTLWLGAQVFEGEFEKDRISKGTLTYGDYSSYVGQFKHSERNGLGKYTFPNCKVIYDGEFKDNQLHGAGTITDEATGESIEVKYDKGRCITELPETIKEQLKKKKKQVVVVKETPKGDEPKQNDDEVIPEVIDQNPADQDDDDDHHNMSDDDI